jgi:hypothetical protein
MTPEMERKFWRDMIALQEGHLRYSIAVDGEGFALRSWWSSFRTERFA